MTPGSPAKACLKLFVTNSFAIRPSGTALSSGTTRLSTSVRRRTPVASPA
jgi:hypothetical protein